jgi:RecA-superfamily ATPases implicated in signal transduction
MKKKGDELSIADLLNLPKIEFEIIPTGIKVLDYILGGGIMNKALTLVTGVTGSGKVSLCYKLHNNFKNMATKFYISTLNWR